MPYQYKIDKYGETFLKKLKKICPCLYNVLCTRKGEHRKTKIFMGFLYGLFLGMVFYELILVDLNFTENAAFIVGGTITFMLAFGIAFSSQIRCISMLSLPNFAGRTGRGVLKAIVLAYLISGPVQNLSNNGKEVVRVFACTTTLTFNLTKTRFELMFKPFVDALFGLKADVPEIKDTLRSIRDISAPITGELEDEIEMRKMKEENDYLDDNMKDTRRSEELDKKYKTEENGDEAAKFEKKYLKKIEMRCEDQFTKATVKCEHMFRTAYDKCYDTVTWAAAWLLCWPMKLDFVCNIAQALGGSNRCDPTKEIVAGFGEGYSYLKKSGKKLSENFKNVKLQYKIKHIKELTDIRDAADTAKAIMHTVQLKKEVLDQILIVVKRILAFIFLRIIIRSQKYHDKYLRDIEYDNIYITKYFRKIDARRNVNGKHTLLPLKKIERKKLVDPWSIKPIKKEREQVVGQTLKLLLEMITATTFILLDRLFYESLDLVRRHARIDYTQVGHHDMKLQIKGTGMIASLLRSVVKGFNIKKRVKVVRSNAECLPRPTRLSNYYLWKIYGMYFVIWILILTQAYLKRTRRLICSYFYRKREKRRVLYLYNETLRRRIGFFRYMKKKVKKLVRERRLEEDLNVCTVLRIRYPHACRCLRIFPMARRKCLICGEPEPFKKSNIPGDFEKCKTPNCYFVHCVECWNDVGRQCFACAVSEDEEDDSGYQDSDEVDHDRG